MAEKVVVTSDQEKNKKSSLQVFKLDSAHDEADDFMMLKKHLQFPNLEEILSKSKSLNVLFIGNLRDGIIADDLIGIKISEMTRFNVIGTDNGVDEIVVYRARKEEIDITLWNMPSLPYHVTNRNSGINEIKKVLDKIDLKIMYIDYQREKELFNVAVFDNLTNFFGNEFWRNESIIINTAASDRNELNEVFRKGMWPEQIRYAGVLSYLSTRVKVPKEIVTTIEVTTVHEQFQSHHLSAFFFFLVESLSSQNAKGALLKINMKRLKCQPDSTDKQCIYFGFMHQQLSSELKLPAKSIVDVVGDQTVTHKSTHGVVVTPAQLSVRPSRFVPAGNTKSEVVDELTHFYTGTHDLQFGAHGEAAHTGGLPTPEKQ